MTKTRGTKAIAAILISATIMLSLTACGGQRYDEAGIPQSYEVPFGREDENNVFDAPDIPDIPVTEADAFDYYYDSDLGGMVVSYYYLESPKVRIPDTLEGEPVTGVVMPYCVKNLTQLVLPDTIKYLELTSESKKGIEYINIPRDMTSVGGFSNCRYLTSITIPDGTTEIIDDAFSDCTSLTSITIPDGVTKIGTNAFSGCENLTSITIPDSVTEIGASAFNGCYLLTSVTIPDGVTVISDGAFSGCYELTSVTIPDSVTKIGESAFDNCISLTSITIPDGVTEIGEGAFNSCTSLTSITIPDGVTKIEYYTFNNCTSLTSVTIGDSVTEILSEAFRDCTSLMSFSLPDGVRSIRSPYGIHSAFYGCNCDITYRGEVYSPGYDNDYSSLGSAIYRSYHVVWSW